MPKPLKKQKEIKAWAVSYIGDEYTPESPIETDEARFYEWKTRELTQCAEPFLIFVSKKEAERYIKIAWGRKKEGTQRKVLPITLKL